MLPRDHSTFRLFVAIYPPPDVARQLLDLLTPLTLPEHTLTPIEHIHITMLFLGERRLGEVESVRESVSSSCRGLRACVVRIERLIVLPETGPARLIAAETDLPPAVGELHRRLVKRLARRGQRDAEGYLPHLTLCRFKGAGVAARPDVSHVLPALSTNPNLSFEATRVHLVRSILHPRGARHETIGSWAIA